MSVEFRQANEVGEVRVDASGEANEVQDEVDDLAVLNSTSIHFTSEFDELENGLDDFLRREHDFVHQETRSARNKLGVFGGNLFGALPFESVRKEATGFEEDGFEEILHR